MMMMLMMLMMQFTCVTLKDEEQKPLYVITTIVANKSRQSKQNPQKISRKEDT